MFTKTKAAILLIISSFVGLAQQQSENCVVPTSLTLTHFNTGKYVPGGHLAVFFEPEGVFELDNEFVLELSDASGSFSTATTLSSKSEFFIPVLNGVIPSGIAPGSIYKLRIRTTEPFASFKYYSNF